MNLSLSISLSFLLSHFISTAQDYSYKPKYSVVLDTALCHRIMSQGSRQTPRNVTGFWMPAAVDIESLENNFKKVFEIKVQPGECCRNGSDILYFEKFGFQYLGVIINQKKYIYINAFDAEAVGGLEKDKPDWKTNPINVGDGGYHYWGVLYEVEIQKFEQLSFNYRY